MTALAHVPDLEQLRATLAEDILGGDERRLRLYAAVYDALLAPLDNDDEATHQPVLFGTTLAEDVAEGLRQVEAGQVSDVEDVIAELMPGRALSAE